jgi:hypothetical protein
VSRFQRNRDAVEAQRARALELFYDLVFVFRDPTLGALALFAAGLATDPDTLMMLEHTVMFPGMLAAMLLRRDEYITRRHARREQVASWQGR